MIGAKKIQVEIDAKYIKGMMEQPDLMPNTPMNRWIQGILLFDFELVHVPATRFKAPDGLSQRRPTEEEIEEAGSADSWLDDIALLAVLDSKEDFARISDGKVNLEEEDQEEYEEPVDRQEWKLRDIERALHLTVMPEQVMTKQEQVRFLNNVSRHYLHEGQLYKR